MNISVSRWFASVCLILTLAACEKSPATEATVSTLSPANRSGSVSQTTEVSTQLIEDAYARKLSDIQVSGQGIVVKLLPDDRKGARHQKFLVRINDRQTLLFAHNIDLAERVPLQPGDHVTFAGEYVYNPKGGIVHWTHHDPQGQHAAGWVMLQGKKYQ
jgi:hypothetical protein